MKDKIKEEIQKILDKYKIPKETVIKINIKES
jgi:hypothetical protein